MDAQLTADRLRNLLSYDRESGLFTWRVTRGRTAKAGSIAGSLSDGYVKIMIDGRTYNASRLAVLHKTGVWPASEVDHKDTDRSNNRWLNLRDVGHVTNAENRQRAHSTSKTGFLGVSKHHRSERYRPRIRVNGKLLRLGWFDTPEEASEAYKQAKRQLHAGCLI